MNCPKKMKTYFYERTAYKLSDEPVPNCFFVLDDHFDIQFATVQDAYMNRAVQLGEMVCGRMADIEVYAFLIADAHRRHVRPGELAGSMADIEAVMSTNSPDSNTAAILIRPFLFGYLSACKYLLDTSAITLAKLYNLPIDVPEQRFDNPDFWHQLVSVVPNVHRRYHSQRIFFNEVTQWRNEAPNRIPPLALLQGNLARRSLHVQLIDEPLDNLGKIQAEPLAISWLDPLDLHKHWKPRLLTLCERLCKDIAAVV